MLEVLVGVDGHLLCVYQLRIDMLLIVIFVFVQIAPQAIVPRSHAYLHYLVGFDRLLFVLIYLTLQ